MKSNFIYFKYHNEQTIMHIPTYVISFYDLTFVIKGSLDYKINNEFITVEENCCMLLPPGTKRQRINTNKYAEYLSFNFTCDENISLPILMKNYIGTEIKHLIYTCIDIAEKNDKYSKEIYENIINTFVLLLSQKNNAKNLSDITKKIMEYIYSNYENKIRLCEICESISYSASYCNAVFKNETGFSIMDFLINHRLNKAKEMLIENILSISEISEKVGLDDPNYFSRLFTKKTKCSPLKYRKKFNK